MINNRNWFSSIPKAFGRFPIWVYSAYVGAGFPLAGMLHLYIWKESDQVETLFSNLALGVKRVSPTIALVLFIITALVAAFTYWMLFRKIRRQAGILELIFWGTVTSFIFSWFPWLYASSLVNTIFLFLFGMTAVTGFGLSIRLSKQGKSKKYRSDSWKMFVNAIKACAAILAVLVGAIATSTLLPWKNTDVEGFELLRYAFLCVYIGIGMMVFIIMPLLVRTLNQKPKDSTNLDFPGPL